MERVWAFFGLARSFARFYAGGDEFDVARRFVEKLSDANVDPTTVLFFVGVVAAFAAGRRADFVATEIVHFVRFSIHVAIVASIGVAIGLFT